MAVIEVSERAQRVHKEAIIIDALQYWFPLQTAETYRKEIRKAIDAGITAIQMTLGYIDLDLAPIVTTWAKFIKTFDAIEEAKLVFTAGDIESAKKEGKLAIVMGLQESRPYERDLDLLTIFYKLGLRVAQPAYFRQTLLASGCAEREDSGLTDRGLEAVEEFNRLGILIDVSHCSDRTAIEAAKASKTPIAVTHSSPHALVGMPRARSDEAIKAVAEKGGVFGQMFQRPFSERDTKIGVRPTLSEVIDLIDYTVKLVGVDHVGLGIDHNSFWFDDSLWRKWATGKESGGTALVHPYSPFYPYPQERYPAELGVDTNKTIIRITEELIRHGYSDEDTKKIMGGNWLRLFKEVWK